MFFNFYLNAMTADSPEGQNWLKKDMSTKLQQHYDWSSIDASKHGAIINTYRGEEMVIDLSEVFKSLKISGALPPKGGKFPLPLSVAGDAILSECFPGKNHQALRGLFVLIEMQFGGKEVQKGTSQYNFMLDDAAIAAIKSFHKTGAKIVADIGCGDGIMSLLYLIAGAKEVHAFDFFSDGSSFDCLLHYLTGFGLLPCIQLIRNGQRSVFGKGEMDKAPKLFFTQADITKPDFSLGKANNYFDQIWAGRFLHAITPDQFQGLKSKILPVLKPSGLLHSVVNAMQFLWTSARTHSAMRFGVEPLMPALDDGARDFPLVIQADMRSMTESKNKFITFSNINLGEGYDYTRANITVFTPRTFMNTVSALGLLPIGDVRALDAIRYAWTTNPEEYFHLYSVARKASVIESILANEALKIPLD